MYNEKDNNEFKALLEEYLPEENSSSRGERVTGKLIQKETTYTLLDVPGQGSAVRVKTEELEDYNVGDEVEVLLLQEIEDDSEATLIIASRRRIDMEDNLEKIKAAFENKEVLTAKIIRKVKGGYILQVLGHQGFLPNSLSEIPLKDGDKMVGKNIEVVVKDFEIV